MPHLQNLPLIAGIFLVGFLVAQITQKVMVPTILAVVLGPRIYKWPASFDAFWMGLIGGFCSLLWFDYYSEPSAKLLNLSEENIVRVVIIGGVLYGLSFLGMVWLQGFLQDWRVKDGTIQRHRGEVLNPLYAYLDSFYNQTDAFSGYTDYYLQLYDENSKLLGTNSYRVESERTRDLARVRTVCPRLRYLDLIFVQRVEPRKWRQHYIVKELVMVWCSPLERLSEADQQWWHSWCFPNLPGREITLDTARWREYLERLDAAYPEYPFESFKKDDGWNKSEATLFREAKEKLAHFLALTDGPISAMNDELYEQSAKDACGDGPRRLLYAQDGFIYLGDAYQEKLDEEKEEPNRKA